MPTRIPASERASQKLDELLSQGVADGDARAVKPSCKTEKTAELATTAPRSAHPGR